MNRIRPRLSLERKLPLIMTALLVLVLGSSLVVTDHEITSSAEAVASQRLHRAGRELAALSGRAIEQRLRIVQRVASDSVLRGALERRGHEAPDSAIVAAALTRYLAPTDVGVVRQLWDVNGDPVAGSGAPAPMPEGTSIARQIRAHRADSAYLSPLYATGGNIYYWLATPVTSGGRRLGWVAEQHLVAMPAPTERQIRALTGESVSIYFHNDSGTFWATASGHPVGEPRGFAAALRNAERGGAPTDGRMLAVDAAIDGTPWKIGLTEPMSAIRTTARGTEVRLTMLGVLILLAGIVVAWFVARRLTRPLVALTGAAEAVARGDYAQHVDDARTDELGLLASSFNRMAADVSAAHAALERQVAEARTVAGELEQANARLRASTAEAQQARGEAERARAEAEQANEAKSQFLATMSHEFRTPLNAIIGYTELLELGIPGAVNDEQLAQLQRIRASARHLVGIVNDVLDLAKIEAGHYSVERHPVAAATTARTAAGLIRPQAEARRIELSLACGDEAITFAGDPQRAEQILTNLLSNAVKFTPPGGRIEVACGRASEPPADTELPAGRWVWLSVHDTGIGIAPEQMASIFHPFVQADARLTRTHGGTGLGLTISRQLARLMGGDITVRSTVGEGSTFTVWLPAAPAAPAASGRDAASAAGAAGAGVDAAPRGR